MRTTTYFFTSTELLFKYLELWAGIKRRVFEVTRVGDDCYEAVTTAHW